MAGQNKPALSSTINRNVASPATFSHPPRPPMVPPQKPINQTSVLQNPPRPPMAPGSAPTAPMAGAPTPPMPMTPGSSGQVTKNINSFGGKINSSTIVQPTGFPQKQNQLPPFPLFPPLSNNSANNNSQNLNANQSSNAIINQEQRGFSQFTQDQSLNNNVSDNGINYADIQYITDLKTLEKFYEDNKYTQILAKRYEDYDLGWNAPRITPPKDELLSQLKYYDDLKKYEKLDERQLAKIELRINEIANKLNDCENYEYYQKFGHERLSYNNDFQNDVFRRVPWYQRDDSIKTYDGYTDHIDIALPKEKYWLAYYNGLSPDEINQFYDDVYVNNVVNENMNNDLLNHPMFNKMSTYGSNADLPNTPILANYPETRSSERMNNSSVNNNKKVNDHQKKHWWSKKDKEKKVDMSANNNKSPQPTGFPQKQNPTPPTQPTGFPQKQNPTPPTQPTGFPPKNNPSSPKPGGFNTQPFNNNSQPTQYFGYQNNAK